MRAAALLLVAVAVVAAEPQRRRGGGFGMSRIAANQPYDGAFRFCRVMFRGSSYGDGDGWSVDWPRADTNLTYRLSELTTTSVGRNAAGDYKNVVLTLTDPELFRCPFIMMTEVGRSYFDEAEAARLQEYLLKGGFLWADDFWGSYAWDVWEGEIRKALPSGAYPIVDLPLDHPIFHTLYAVRHLPQIPSINFWVRSGGQTSERGSDSAEPHARAISDASGRMMVLITHNTDFGDAFERETDYPREYFDTFASAGYAFGINAFLYAMSR